MLRGRPEGELRHFKNKPTPRKSAVSGPTGFPILSADLRGSDLPCECHRSSGTARFFHKSQMFWDLSTKPGNGCLFWWWLMLAHATERKIIIDLIIDFKNRKGGINTLLFHLQRFIWHRVHFYLQSGQNLSEVLCPSKSSKSFKEKEDSNVFYNASVSVLIPS